MTTTELLLKRLKVVALRVLNSSGGTSAAISIADMSEYGRTNEEKLLLQIIAALQGVVGGGAGASFPNDVTVTNGDEAFDHMTTVAAGASVVDVLTAILTKYNGATIVLNSLKVLEEKANSDNDGNPGAYGTEQTYSFQNNYIEIGRGFKVVGFVFTIGNHTNTHDTGVKFYVNGSLHQESISDTGSPVTLTNSSDTEYNTVGVSGETKAYKCTVLDIGPDASNPFDPPLIRTSGTKNIITVDRAAVGTHTSNTMDGYASNVFPTMTMISDIALNPLRPKGDIVVTGNDNTNSTSFYMWIAYPKTWGLIATVLQGSSNPTEVQDAFTTREEHNISNAYGIVIPYYFYRSQSTKPFAVGETITITFN
jgi:hypothetical protein|tara:strand:+ start:460 stop:1557 length:1098 start_codon:yes stop_codon:yes gene_type:complete